MQKLFNEERKLQFLDSLPSYQNERTKKNYENLLYSIGEYEYQLNKDFCDMNVPEVKMIIVSMGIIATSSLGTIISILKDYSNWCISNGKTNSENSLLKMTIDDFDISFNIRCKLLKSPEHLHQILLSAFGKSFEELNGYAFQSQLIAWLLYFGFSKDEILNLKKHDVKDIESIRTYKQCVDFGDKTELILNLLDLCSNLDVIVSSTANIFIKREYLVESQYVLRGKQNKRSKNIMALSLFLGRIRAINIRYSENTEQLIELTSDRLSLSGKFYKLYLMEKTGIIIESKVIYDIFEMNYQGKVTISNETSKKLKDYNNWKTAFEL